MPDSYQNRGAQNEFVQLVDHLNQQERVKALSEERRE